MAYQYKTKGVCSRTINFDIQDGKVRDVRFDGGCDGNTHGIVRLVEGRPVEEIIALLKGIDCRGRGTSCPDQLAKALQTALEQA